MRAEAADDRRGTTRIHAKRGLPPRNSSPTASPTPAEIEAKELVPGLLEIGRRQLGSAQ
jgi:hypothetical protein